ncbi:MULTISPECIES: NUDIX hydrolase [unclassified Pseudonocardia]|uniref:NUDIX hydrolase n=1 Tax=unclassified Pseudonocardia TaxID=2619320 RepID=UPI001CF63E36|nr:MULTISPECIES: NUDIX hydrolase [unclassified Pseudonocardia]
MSVAGVVVDDSDRILAVERMDNGRWEAPGGILELGETLAEGVRREVAEETGVHVEVGRMTGVYQNLTLGVVALVFRCRPIGGVPTPSEESRRVEWLTLDEVRERMPDVFAIRVLDAFGDSARHRVHDGVSLIG